MKTTVFPVLLLALTVLNCKLIQMLTISLSGVRFHAPVGLYPQETLIHNEIEMHISVSLKASIDSLPMIDYTVLHSIAGKAVQEPAALLETIIQRIVNNIESVYPGCKMKVAVRKLHPPIMGEVGHAEVKWES